ncbi:MAG TPA: AraC family transcriptional regulator [Cellulomonas sp.]
MGQTASALIAVDVADPQTAARAGSTRAGRSDTFLLDARHPQRSDLGICIAPIGLATGCRSRCPDDQPVRAAFHILTLCEQGTATQLVDGAEHQHRPGSVLWIPPGTAHQMVPVLTGVAVCFTSSFAGPALAERTGGAWDLAPREMRDVASLVGVLRSEYLRYVDDQTGPQLRGGDLVLQHLLLALLTRLQSMPRRVGAGDAAHPVARRFLEMVETNCRTMRRVEDYAEALGYSTRTLQRICYEQMGAGPRDIIDTRIAAEAERLLASTNLPVSAVGRWVGFADAANFSKFFQRQTGWTPGEFRRVQLG